jgi:hypothetical protein
MDMRDEEEEVDEDGDVLVVSDEHMAESFMWPKMTRNFELIIRKTRGFGFN